MPADPQPNTESTSGSGPTVHLYSFGFQYSGIPADDAGHGGGFVFDCRCLPNPHWEEALRPHTGNEAPVVAFFEAHAEVAAYLGHVTALVLQAARQYRTDGRERLMVSCGCTGGRHRSVYVAERLAEALHAAGFAVRLTHADLGRTPSARAEAARP